MRRCYEFGNQFHGAREMIGRMNHIGIATPSVETTAAMYRDLYGAVKIGKAFVMEAQGVRVLFVDVPNTQLELIEPYGEKSPLKNFLEKNPAGGQHHVCFEVPDIIAAHGTPVLFVHPKNSDGVLVELMETPKGAH
jgi:methylmalonyl-CoA/ethylmalonyl-CoA epimerase